MPHPTTRALALSSLVGGGAPCLWGMGVALALVGCAGSQPPADPQGVSVPPGVSAPGAAVPGPAPVPPSPAVPKKPPPATAPAVAPAPARPDVAPGQAEPLPAALDKADTQTVLEQGLASWYGKRFHGRLTANGERFDMNAMTAAHKTLPFGTVLRVRSLRTGREVVVRVNDRGPFVKGRIIDLSAAAALKLGMHQRGVGRVQLLPE